MLFLVSSPAIISIVYGILIHYIELVVFLGKRNGKTGEPYSFSKVRNRNSETRTESFSC